MADFKVTQLDLSLDFDNLSYWDVVIIGAGPGGLAASLTTAHRGLTTLVVEAKRKPGGQPEFLYADKKIVDIPGFPDGITGEELSARNSSVKPIRWRESLESGIFRNRRGGRIECPFLPRSLPLHFSVEGMWGWDYPHLLNELSMDSAG